MDMDDLRYEDLNGEIVVLDTAAAVVHRISGDTARAVRAETDPVTRRTLVRAAVALGVAAGVTTLNLPSAAASASGGGVPWNGSSGDDGGPKPVGTPSADPGLNSMDVTWTNVYGATSYRVYRRVSGVNPYVLAAQVADPGESVSTSTATIPALVAGTAYDFMVVTVGAGGLVSGASNPVTATPLGGGLATPTNFEVFVATDGGVPPGEAFAQWTPTSGANSEIQVRQVGSSWTTIDAGGTTNFSFKELVMGATYEFRVRAYTIVSGTKSVSAWTSVISKVIPD